LGWSTYRLEPILLEYVLGRTNKLCSMGSVGVGVPPVLVWSVISFDSYLVELYNIVRSGQNETDVRLINI
jgi:hypothetical protein